ncbi:DUF2267 domain-containing protein [Streptomyces sp. 2A115]|uniref:DUF2267 domain-containing protein n=1 Tax=Streptomyces sp. 2A115 TaxID=3457439 RepID=UPI003FD651ED
MSYGEFLSQVRERGGYEDTAEVARTAEAVVSALGSRMQPDAARKLADQLPKELATALTAENRPAATWGVHEFVQHVAETTGSGEEEARRHTQCVLTVLGETVSGGELNKLISGLPAGYAELLGHPELT